MTKALFYRFSDAARAFRLEESAKFIVVFCRIGTQLRSFKPYSFSTTFLELARSNF